MNNVVPNEFSHRTCYNELRHGRGEEGDIWKFSARDSMHLP